MLIYTAKVNKRTLLTILVSVVLLIVAAVILLIPNRDDAGSQATLATANIKTNEQRIAFISSLGYTVDAQPTVVKEVLIPKEFDDTYSEYNDMQKQCGFDLQKFQGKRAMHYVYAVTGEQLNIEILVNNDKIIGGSIYSVAADGFMQGLTAKQ